MTETPDDLPNPVERNEDGELGYSSTEERIRRWDEAQARALAEGITPREALTRSMLERRKATMGPNPTQEKARKLYEWWRDGCGGAEPYSAEAKALTEMTQDMRTYDNLHPYEQARWAVLAKALGHHPYHDHYSKFTTGGEDERGSKKLGSIGWAEYDDVLHPNETKWDEKGSYIPISALTYPQWVKRQPKPRKHKWQFWREVEVDTSYHTYRLWAEQYKIMIDAHKTRTKLSRDEMRKLAQSSK